MIPNPPIHPPRHYVSSVAAWLRLGKIAVIGALAMLAVAGGLAFPGAPAAEAQSSQAGYTYTQRVCQEYGQHPRYYYVRDPIPGSDWRNDGGWAIILDRGAGLSRTTTTFIPGNNPYRTLSSFNADYTVGDPLIDNSAGTRSKRNVSNRLTGSNHDTQRPTWLNLPAYTQGDWDGYQGLIVLQGGSPSVNHLVVLDVDKDGNIDGDDDIFGNGSQVAMLWYTTTEEIIGGSTYVRWADLAWCR